MNEFHVRGYYRCSMHIRGATLILCLTMLTLVMLFVTNGMETVNLQEKMTKHSYERNLGLQGAEWAVRLGEEVAQYQWDNGHPDIPAPMSWNFNNCAKGLCAEPDDESYERWSDDSFTGWQEAAGYSDDRVKKIEYVVEYLGDDFACSTTVNDPRTCNRYRITTRATFGEGQAKVMLQSLYATN